MIPFFQSDIESSNWIAVAAHLGYGTAGITIIAIAFYGWGRLTRHLTGLPIGTWPVSAALGLACVLFLGGLLNLCRVAYPLTLAGIVIAGLMLAVGATWYDRLRGEKPEDGHVWYHAAPWGIATLALMGFTVATQLAPSHYNTSDDFQHFFGHAVRMVQTGTLYGGPLNGLGGEVLGGQAFLHGFIVGYFPLQFINGADAVFCFFLCLALAGGVGFGRPALGLAALIGTLAVFLIDPQYVNVSSLYSTAAMVSALLILSVDPREKGNETSPHWRQAAAPALLYAGMIALKNTGIVFVGLQFGIATMAVLLTRDWRAGLAHAGRIATWTGIFVLPWLLLYVPFYLVGLTHPLGAPLTPVPRVQDSENLFSLFSPENTFYGASRLSYTCLAIGLFLCAFLAVMRARREGASRRSLVEFAAVCAAAGGTYLFWMLIGPRLQESSTTLRYTIPVLIGAASAALPLWASISNRGGKAVCVSVAALLLLLFASPMRERLSALVNQRSALAFIHQWGASVINDNRAFTERMLQGEGAAEVRRLQALIPPGETVLAWTVVPFHLDYRRNRIIDVTVAGLGQAWGRISPPRYVFWQHSGYAANGAENFKYDIAAFGRRTGALEARALDVLRWFEEIAAVSEKLVNQNGVIVFRTNERMLPPPN